MMMLLSLLAQVAVPAAPPAPPAPLRVASHHVPGAEAQQRIRLDISIRSPEGVMWSGALWVAPQGSSSWRQSLTEPLAASCSTQRYAYGSDQSELSIQLTLVRGDDGAAPSRINVTARWSRPSEAPCGGTRTVEVRQTEPLPERGLVTVNGDGGLVIEMRRR